MNDSQDLGLLIIQIYNIAIGVVGLAVFIQFIHAGLLYIFAAGNSSKSVKAHEIMQNAVIGAILLLSSYLILNVINPDLLNVNIFNLDEIKTQIQKSKVVVPATTGSPAVLPTSSPTKPAQTPPANNSPAIPPNQTPEETLQKLGIDWLGGDLTSINQKDVSVLSKIHAECQCDLAVEGFKSTSGGDSFSLYPTEKTYDVVKNNSEMIDEQYTQMDGSITSVIITRNWEDRTNGALYQTMSKCTPVTGLVCIEQPLSVKVRVKN